MEWLASMASLGERLAHALKTRGKKALHLDKYLADRFEKKGTGTGYAHRVIKQGQRPSPEVLTAMCDYLEVDERWLLTGQGAMDRGAGAVPTYDSLPGWADAAAIEAKAGRVAPFAIRAAGRSPVFVKPNEVDANFVFRAASFWLEVAPPEERLAATKAEADRLRAEEDKPRASKRR